jgi:uncharacterized membrane protein
MNDKMMSNIYTVLKILVVLILLDGVFLFLMRNYFAEQVRLVQNAPLTMNILGAVLCYIIICLGLFHFIINKKATPSEAFLLGLFVYGVYETTSLALLKSWKLTTVITDTLWGGVLFFLITYIFNKLKL